MTDLRTALGDLADDQPQQPADRLHAVTGRARRIHRTRVAVSVAAAVAVLAGGGAVVATAGREPAVPTYASAADWPERSTGQGDAYSDRAVAAWAAQDGPVLDQPHFLFRGEVPRDGGTEYVAVWTAGSENGTVLVAAHAETARLSDGTAVDPWTVSSGRPRGHVGLYLPGTVPTLFVLGPPSARELDLAPDIGPYADVALPDGMTPFGPQHLESRDGVFTVRAPGLTGTLDVTFTDAEQRTTAPADLSGDLGGPDLAHPRSPDLPADFEPVVATATTIQPGGAERLEAFTGPIGSAYVRCYGTSGVRWSLGERPQRETVPCDGQTHVLFDRRLADDDRIITLAADGLVAYSLAVGT